MYINTEQLSNSLTRLKSLKDRLVRVLNSQNQLVKSLQSSWSGTVGDYSYQELVNHSKQYEGYIGEVNEKIAFIENTIQAYKSMDSSLSKKIDDNVQK